MSEIEVSESDVVHVIGTLLAAFFGAWFGYLLASKQERTRNAALFDALRRAAIAETQHCAGLASHYLAENILAPAYRFSFGVWEVAFPHLVASGRLSPEAVGALIDFRSQISQVNWLLDEIHRHRRAGNDNAMMEEVGRLKLKLQEMTSPESRFYTPAIRALR